MTVTMGTAVPMVVTKRGGESTQCGRGAPRCLIAIMIFRGGLRLVFSPRTGTNAADHRRRGPASASVSAKRLPRQAAVIEAAQRCRRLLTTMPIRARALASARGPRITIVCTSLRLVIRLRSPHETDDGQHNTTNHRTNAALSPSAATLVNRADGCMVWDVNVVGHARISVLSGFVRWTGPPPLHQGSSQSVRSFH